MLAVVSGSLRLKKCSKLMREEGRIKWKDVVSQYKNHVNK